MVTFNLSLDDVHPEKGFGLLKWDGPFQYCKKLIDEYPDIIITLFVTPNWIDLPNVGFFKRQVFKILNKNYTRTWQGEPFRLDKHKEWCDWINSIKNFEVCVHGYNHHLNKNPHSAEFKDLDYKTALEKIKKSEELFKESGLKYVKGFRPPGWGVSQGMFKALKKMNYLFCASETQGSSVKTREGILIIPQNWDISKDDIEKGKLIAKEGLLMAKGHIQSSYYGEDSGNGLTKESYVNIKKLLNSFDNIKFSSMKNIASKHLKKQSR